MDSNTGNQVALYRPNDNIAKQGIRKIDGVIAQGKAIIGKFEKAYPISYKIVGGSLIVAGGASEGLYGAFLPFMYGTGKIIDYTCKEQFDRALDRYVVNPFLKMADISPRDVEYNTARTLFTGSLTASIGGAYGAKMLQMQKNMLPSATPIKPTNIKYGEGFAAKYESFPTQVQWTSPSGTKQTYKVYQRKDIDWSMVRSNPDGPKKFIGKTNKEAALSGLRPELPNGDLVSIHHVGQNAKGPLVEISSKTHSRSHKALHSQFGTNMKHPEFPVQHDNKWKSDVRNYWTWRIENEQ